MMPKDLPFVGSSTGRSCKPQQTHIQYAVVEARCRFMGVRVSVTPSYTQGALSSVRVATRAGGSRVERCTNLNAEVAPSGSAST